MCWSIRSLVRWQPQQSQIYHGSDGPGYLDRTPTCTGPLSGPFRVRIEAWQRWGGVGQSFPGGLGSKQSRMFCDRNEEMMLEKCSARVVETKYGGAMRMLKQKRKPLPLWNEAQLNCVSLRSLFDYGVTCGPVQVR